jgi:hypothetical protein
MAPLLPAPQVDYKDKFRNLLKKDTITPDGELR